MPKVRRKDVPRPLFEHLVLRVHERSIGADAIENGLETKTRAGGKHGLIGRDDLFNSES